MSNRLAAYAYLEEYQEKAESLHVATDLICVNHIQDITDKLMQHCHSLHLNKGGTPAGELKPILDRLIADVLVMEILMEKRID